MRIQAIDHVTLSVRSVARAQKYYEEVFGLTCERAPVGGSDGLRLENEAVHFFMVEDSELDPEYVRRQHLSFAVDSLEPVIKCLEARGEQYEIGRFEGFTHRNYRWCEWRDPEGIRVECVESLVSDGASDGSHEPMPG